MTHHRPADGLSRQLNPGGATRSRARGSLLDCGTDGGPKPSSLRAGRFASAEFESRPAHCRETGQIRSAIGCDGVGPRHRAGLGVQRALEGTLPRCKRRPGRLVRGRQTVSRRAHNPEIPSSILGPAIDRFDTSAERGRSTTARRLGHPRTTIRTPNVTALRSASYQPCVLGPGATPYEGDEG